MHDEHREVDKAWWDERAPVHAASRDYAVHDLIADPGRLSGVVEFDVPRLGDVTGLRGVHLQCHIGTDTLSLSRLGAHMTGLDFSPASVAIARRIAAEAGAVIDYVESDVYNAPLALGENRFDLVYTGIGALIWLPDVHRWAEVVASLLRPNGRLFLREGHPVLWAIDEQRTDALVLGYPYFERPEPTRFQSDGTYVDTDTDTDTDITFRHTESREWNHGLGELITALLDAGMELTMLVEHDSVPWEALPGRMHRREGEWYLDDNGDRLPLSYTLQAVKRA